MLHHFFKSKKLISVTDLKKVSTVSDFCIVDHLSCVCVLFVCHCGKCVCVP